MCIYSYVTSHPKLSGLKKHCHLLSVMTVVFLLCAVSASHAVVWKLCRGWHVQGGLSPLWCPSVLDWLRAQLIFLHVASLLSNMPLDSKECSQRGKLWPSPGTYTVLLLLHSIGQNWSRDGQSQGEGNRLHPWVSGAPRICCRL